MTDDEREAQIRRRETEDADERRMFRDGADVLSGGDPLLQVANTLAVWHRMAPPGSQREMFAIMANETRIAAGRLDEARAEIDRLRAPPEADVTERAQKVPLPLLFTGAPGIIEVDGSLCYENIARALREYGEQRAREAIDGVRIITDNIPNAISAAKRDARAAAFEEAIKFVSGGRDVWPGMQAILDGLLALATEPKP